MSTTPTAPATTNLPAKSQPKPLVLQADPGAFEIAAAEDLLDTMERIKGDDITKAVAASINMVTTYLKFSAYKGQPLRRFFVGWTARPLVDFQTKEPICDPETGAQQYGPAVIFYNPETEAMEVNQAFDIVKTLHDHRPPKGTKMEMTYLGLEPTAGGKNKQTFKIIFLKDEA